MHARVCVICAYVCVCLRVSVCVRASVCVCVSRGLDVCVCVCCVNAHGDYQNTRFMTHRAYTGTANPSIEGDSDMHEWRQWRRFRQTGQGEAATNGGRPSRHQLQLNIWLVAARNQNQILELVRDKLERFNPINVATALHRLAKFT